MALILNIETATEVCSVNLARNSELLAERETTGGMNHSEMLTVFIDEIFRESGISLHQLEAVAVSKGPGSYTGLRIGVSVAKGLCYSLGIPLLAVGTLDAMGMYTAENRKTYFPDAGENILLCPMIDARRMEVYTALYDVKGTNLEPVSAKIIDGEAFSTWLTQYRVLFFGNGAEKCRIALTHPNALFCGPKKASARFMIKYAEEMFNNKKWEDVAYFEPFYLKDFIATVPRKKISK